MFLPGDMWEYRQEEERRPRDGNKVGERDVKQTKWKKDTIQNMTKEEDKPG